MRVAAFGVVLILRSIAAVAVAVVVAACGGRVVGQTEGSGGSANAPEPAPPSTGGSMNTGGHFYATPGSGDTTGGYAGRPGYVSTGGYPMTDGSPGASGASTGSGGDTSTEPTRSLVTLALGQDGPYALAVDAVSVYWTTWGFSGPYKGTVMKVPLAGGALTTLATGQESAADIAVDSTSVYWSNGTLMKVPLDGGTPVTLASDVSTDPIAVGPHGIYGTGRVDGNITVLSVPLGGGSPTALAPSGALAPSYESYGVAVDATNVYWTNFMDPCTVMKVPLGGGTPITLASAPGAGFGIALDATHAYWITSGLPSGVVMKVLLNGGTPTILANEGGMGIAVDARSVYFTTSDAVKKVPLNGGTPIPLATGQDKPNGIAVDATSVYWTNVGSGDLSPTGSVMKLTPK